MTVNVLVACGISECCQTGAMAPPSREAVWANDMLRAGQREDIFGRTRVYLCASQSTDEGRTGT